MQRLLGVMMGVFEVVAGLGIALTLVAVAAVLAPPLAAILVLAGLGWLVVALVRGLHPPPRAR